MSKLIRQSNFELLRIIAMFMIMTVHADFWLLGAPDRTSFSLSVANSVTRVVIECAAIVGVNVFVLLSGWFSIKPTVKGFAKFMYQIAFYLIGVYIFFILLGYDHVTLKGVATHLLFTQGNWFIKSYICLYLMAPILNAYVDSSSRKQLTLTVFALFTFEFIYGWTGSSLDISNGYSIYSFICLYLLARCVRLYYSSKMTLVSGGGAYLATVLINSIILCYLCSTNAVKLTTYVLSYVNPLVVLGALGIFMFFANLNITGSKCINFISASSFSVYLFHTNHAVFGCAYKNILPSIYHDYNGIICILVMLSVLIAIYIVTIVVDQLRIKSWNYISSNFFKTK